MTTSTLIIQAILDNKVRSLLLILTIAVAFLMYGILGALRFSMFGGTDEFSENRLIVTHESGMTQSLPITYADRMRSLDDVASVSPATWFGAYYQNPKNMLMAFAVDPQSWLDQHTEMRISEDHTRQFLGTANGMLVSEALLHKYNWKVGDNVPLKSIMFFPDSGDEHWSFTVSGTFTNAAEAGGRNYIIMHYKYLDEARTSLRNTAGTYVVTAKPGADVQALAIGIDEYFAKFENRTATTTDRAFHTEFFKQLGDISLIIQAILMVSFTSIIIVVASTLTLTIHQKLRDIGILKVIGFTRAKVAFLVVGEAVSLVVIGGLTGALLAILANQIISVNLPNLLPNLTLTAQVAGEMVLVAVLVCVLVCALPTVLANRLKPIKALGAEV